MTKSKVLILGAGAGGISVAAKLARNMASSDITIVDPSEFHFYQPLWTLVGAGLVDKEVTKRKQSDVIPSGVKWIQESVAKIDAVSQTVELQNSKKIHYDFLVVATGLILRWDKIEGLGNHLGSRGICSIYDFNQAEATYNMIKNFDGGEALFVMPPTPIKCAGAPQKIMYLAEEIFRECKIRERTNVTFAAAGKVIFGIPEFAKPLEAIVKERNIITKFSHKIVGVDAENQMAVFEVPQSDGSVKKESLKYDLLHLVPPMSAHSFIAESDLAVQDGDQKGWLSVDKFTLQHTKYKNIFGVGDVTGVPNSKTGAAVRKQYPVVVQNLLSVMKGAEPTAKYDGYSSCPLVTQKGRVILAEFGYDGKLMPSFPVDLSVPRYSMWVLKRYLLPHLYWSGMLKGIA